jgi:hypothetical protein
MTPLAPLPVFCVVENVYRDRAIAESVCCGRFRHQGLELDLGVEPDWLGAALPPDREWRLEWVKFYYGLDLAWAYRETGELRFQEAWERLVRSWIRQVPVSLDPSDVVGRRIQNWIYAWNGFAAADRFDGLGDGMADLILQSLGAQVAHLRGHLTRERNHRTLELYALFIAALALPVLDPSGELLAFAVDELHRNILADIGQDGVQRERSTHYHHVVLRSFLGARENACRFGLTFHPDFDERLIRACDFSLHVQRPDGSIPALSDSDGGSYLDLLRLAARLFGRSDWLYAATRGEQGVKPAHTAASFPAGGYFVQRSGWSSDAERYLVFDCGPVGDGGHGHYDALSIEAACGRPLVVDPGRFTYCDDPPHWRRWFKSTAAHNTITVDGLDQTPYYRGKPKSGMAHARLVERLTAPGLDLLCGEVTSPAYDAVHRRRILFVGDAYWIVHDTVTGTRPHRYLLRFHLAAAIDRQPALASVAAGAARTPGLALVVAPPWPIAIEEGWVSARYGIKEPAPIVTATADEVACADFFTLLMPLGESTPMPSFVVTRDADDEDRFSAEVSVATAAGDRCDRVMWTASGRPAAWTNIGAAASAAAVLDVAAGARPRIVIPEPVDVYAGVNVCRPAAPGVAV